jgi:sec-independent protein translocase protein TatA
VFGTIGPQEVLIVLVIALVVLGPKRLPEMARSLGQGVKEFKEAISEGLDAHEAHGLDSDDEDADPYEPASSRVHELPPAEPPPFDLPPAAPAPEAAPAEPAMEQL